VCSYKHTVASYKHLIRTENQRRKSETGTKGIVYSKSYRTREKAGRHGRGGKGPGASRGLGHSRIS
jgi:hypothetical protein